MNDHVVHPLIGSSEAMEDLRKSIDVAAPTDMTVLIQGERGTGKELVAHAIHRGSDRTGGPFIAVNCASLPESLIESELFGHEKGAFTGADTDRKGKFELAHGGTLFLDEIGELSLAAQSKLLRVLETREIDRIGGQRPVPIDFRLIAATNRDLERLAGERKFREDLYDRLNVYLIRTPALRDRLDDIRSLAHHFALYYARQTKRVVRGVSRTVLDFFRKHSWPGNVRELQNVIRVAVLTGKNEMVELEDLPFEFVRKTVVASVKLGNYYKALHDVSRQLCVHALDAARGNCRKAAGLLHLNRTHFYKIARMHGLGGEQDA